MDARDKLVIHEGYTQLQEMRLEMLKTVLWRGMLIPLLIALSVMVGATGFAWFINVCFVPLLRGHG